MGTLNRAAMLALAAAGLVAGAPISTVMQTKPAIMRGQSVPKIHKGGRFFGLVPQRDDARVRHRSKPWTCTAIEQRRAAKRRNVKRARARRRA